MSPQATAHAIKLRVEDVNYGCAVRRVIGYKAECTCGWKGERRAHWITARDDARAHNKGHRGA